MNDDYVEGYNASTLLDLWETVQFPMISVFAPTTSHVLQWLTVTDHVFT